MSPLVACGCRYASLSQDLIVQHQSFVEYGRDQLFQGELEDVGLTLPEFQVRSLLALARPVMPNTPALTGAAVPTSG